MKKILAFAGSNSSSSINKQLIRYTASLIEHHEVTIIELNDFEAPIFSVELEVEEGHPASMVKLKALFDDHDAYIFASPEYNGFMPAVAKNTIDWISRLSRPIFQDKPLFLMSASPGPRGGASNLKYMADAFQYRGGKIIGTFSFPSFQDNFDSQNEKITNETLNSNLKLHLSKLNEALS